MKIPIRRDDDSREDDPQKPTAPEATPELSSVSDVSEPPLAAPQTPEIPTAEARLQEIETALANKTQECDTVRDQLVRLMADFDNYRKRMVRQSEESRQFATTELVKELLPGLEICMSELANEIASDSPTVSTDAQLYVVGVRLPNRLANRSSSYRVEGKWLRFGDACVVEHGDDVAVGKVWLPPRLPTSAARLPKPRVLRKASLEEVAREEQRVELEEQAHRYCAEAIHVHGLAMKLGKVEYTLDGRKGTFFFTAEGRIDFRELVKDLAHRLRIRVEMRQVGVRDEAGLLGGAGICGRELCCSTWLKELKPVSIKAAKQQGLMLNPAKLSGVCGRLRCCLNYELPGFGGGGCGGGNCKGHRSS